MTVLAAAWLSLQARQAMAADRPPVTAVVLAAGRGERMGLPAGQCKQLLPWGDTTILGQTIRQVQGSAVQEVLVITGYLAAAVAAEARVHGAAVLHNPDYEQGEMISSLQTAVRRLPETTAAILVVLGDQPLVPPEVMDRLLEAFWAGRGSLVAPGYRGRRGNPVVIGRQHFAALLALPPEAAPRDLLAARPDALHILAVDTPAVLLDLDRPEAYERHRPGRPRLAGSGEQEAAET